MYCEFYGLKERPFNVTSDPSFFFSSLKHREALSHLVYGASQKKGIIVITGEIGTGKTTLCRFFLNRLGNNTKTAFIMNPHASENQLLEAIVKDFGVLPKDKLTRLSLMWSLNQFLINESRAANNVILIIDEAQNLSPSQLEQVRLLSNFETEKEKLIQIILVGQPELNRKLNMFELRQLQQRVMVRCHISPLDKEEIKDYINHRLAIAGPQNKITFTQPTYQLISEFSGGTPRLINILCDRALLAGFVLETFTIDEQVISRCLEELSGYFSDQVKT